MSTKGDIPLDFVFFLGILHKVAYLHVHQEKGWVFLGVRASFQKEGIFEKGGVERPLCPLWNFLLVKFVLQTDYFFVHLPQNFEFFVLIYHNSFIFWSKIVKRLSHYVVLISETVCLLYQYGMSSLKGSLHMIKSIFYCWISFTYFIYMFKQTKIFERMPAVFLFFNFKLLVFNLEFLL